MATIQIEVSAELAERLQRYQHELPRILEESLHNLERENAVQQPSDQSDEETLQRIYEALCAAGAVGPTPEERRRHLAEHDDWAPLEISGQPLSEMIIEERKSRSWDDGS